MKIMADIREFKKLVEDAAAIEAGPVHVEICGTLTLTVTTSDGKIILDTTVDVDI